MGWDGCARSRASRGGGGESEHDRDRDRDREDRRSRVEGRGSRGRGVEKRGAAGIVATPSSVVQGDALLDRFGTTLTSLHDVNGDGFADFAVGAMQIWVPGTTGPGWVNVYFGKATGIVGAPERVLTGVSLGDQFGRSVASGDLNGDGHSDALIGAYFGDPPGLPGCGTMGVYLGSTAGLASAPIRLIEGSVADGCIGE